MARTNPRIDQLETEVAHLRSILESRRQDPGEFPLTGCGDNSCIVLVGFSRGGQRTNGGCRCEKHTLRSGLAWWRRKAEFLGETIRELKVDMVSEYERGFDDAAAMKERCRDM